MVGKRGAGFECKGCWGQERVDLKSEREVKDPMKALTCVVLAAGQGVRMKSTLPKVLHKLNGVPMVRYVLLALKGLRPDKVIVVAGRDNEKSLKKALRSEEHTSELQSH